jgi:preprotein translocase subunit SecB
MANASNGTNGNGQPGNGGDQAPQGAGPQLSVLAQYTKDFSFENPNAPRSLQPSQQQPSINLQINVNANTLAGNDVEVELKIDGKAEVGDTVLFAFDLVYAGVFRIQNVPQNELHPVIMIECPRLLFPFARELVASAVRNGGFPPLMIDPIDFVGLYRQKIAEAQQTSATPS